MCVFERFFLDAVCVYVRVAEWNDKYGPYSVCVMILVGRFCGEEKKFQCCGV